MLKKLLFLFFFLNYILNLNFLYAQKSSTIDKSNIKKMYHLKNGDSVIIENYERGDRIWIKKINGDAYFNISHIWNFIALAEKCEGIENKDIYFAINLEYWLGGGTNLENPQIRIFNLYDPSPWRDSDVGIVPNMKWAKQFCTFYNEG